MTTNTPFGALGAPTAAGLDEQDLHDVLGNVDQTGHVDQGGFYTVAVDRAGANSYLGLMKEHLLNTNMSSASPSPFDKGNAFGGLSPSNANHNMIDNVTADMIDD
jgi:hypothetical protein